MRAWFSRNSENLKRIVARTFFVIHAVVRLWYYFRDCWGVYVQPDYVLVWDILYLIVTLCFLIPPIVRIVEDERDRKARQTDKPAETRVFHDEEWVSTEKAKNGKG